MSQEGKPQFASSISGVLLRPIFICVALAAVTLAVYAPVRNFDFINLDDPDYVLGNEHVMGGLRPDSIKWAFTSGHTGNWHPLTWLSLMLDQELFGESYNADATWPHVVSVMFHVANTILLFLILRELTRAHWRSAFVAALFALHPLHVESVAWISERKDVLSTLFWLLALGAYGRYAVALKVTGPKRKLYYRLALIFFALGLMSKPMLVTLPFVLLLLDFWPLARFPEFRFEAATFKQLVTEKIPFFGLSATSCVITFLVQRDYGAVRSLTHFPIGTRIENALVSYARYLGKMFWPTDLVVHYPHPGHWPLTFVSLAAIVIVGLTGIVLWRRRVWTFAVTGWFWFLGTLVPVIGLVQVGRQSMADRYTYVPLIGLLIVVSWGAAALVSRWRMMTMPLSVAAVLAIGACAAGTVRQIGYWQNSELLFRHAIDRSQNNYLAHDNLAIYLFSHGKQDEATEEFRRAVEINPDDPDALNGLGGALATRQDYAAANQCMERLLQVHPKDAMARFNYGAILIAQEKWDQAAAQFSEAVRLKPDFVEARQQLEMLKEHIPK